MSALTIKLPAVSAYLALYSGQPLPASPRKGDCAICDKPGSSFRWLRTDPHEQEPELTLCGNCDDDCVKHGLDGYARDPELADMPPLEDALPPLPASPVAEEEEDTVQSYTCYGCCRYFNASDEEYDLWGHGWCEACHNANNADGDDDGLPPGVVCACGDVHCR